MKEIRASALGYKADGSTAAASVDRNQNAIQTALYQLNPTNSNAGGGRLIIDDGGYGLVRGGFDLPFGVAVECLGPGRTILMAADNSNQHMFVPHRWAGPGTPPNAMKWAVSGLTIDIRRSHQSTTDVLCGIYSSTNPWNTIPPAGADGKQVDYDFDPTGLIEDVEVRNADTAVMIVGRSGIRHNRVVAHACTGAGFVCDFDTTYHQCHARFGGAGFDLRLSNNQLTLCTSFNNKTFGYRARGTYDMLASCVAHENASTAFDFAATTGLSASALVAYEPGFENQAVVYGYDLAGARFANVHGTYKATNPNARAYRMDPNTGNVLWVTAGGTPGPNIVNGVLGG